MSFNQTTLINLLQKPQRPKVAHTRGEKGIVMGGGGGGGCYADPFTKTIIVTLRAKFLIYYLNL